MPTPCLLLTPDLVMCEANAAYLRATQRTREELLGRHLFTAFPDNPEDGSADGVAALSASLQRVLATGAADTMALQRYDIAVPGPDGERWERRWWSPVNAPVLDVDGRTVLLIHRVEDVTDVVRRLRSSDVTASELRERVTLVEADPAPAGRARPRFLDRACGAALGAPRAPTTWRWWSSAAEQLPGGCADPTTPARMLRRSRTTGPVGQEWCRA